jgi:hypothetical protein
MGFRVQRKSLKIGSSLAVVLPRGWCDYYGDRAKKVTIVGTTLLVIAPAGLEDQAQKLVEKVEAMGSK